MLIDSFEHSLSSIEKKFGRLVLDSNWVRSSLSISWEKYHHYVGKRAYVRQYEHLLSSRQYSFLLRDGSFFQFFYDFKASGKINAARLAFYPAPMESQKYNEVMTALNDIGLDVDWSDDFLIEYYSDSDALVQVENLSHVRIDYDSSVTSHSKGHMQYGALNSLRIATKHIVSPFVFFDFIVRSVHADDYKVYSEKRGFSAFLLNERKEHNLYQLNEKCDTLHLKI